MAGNTSIEWTRGDDGTPGATWNPVTGCTKVSPGCDHCYAETFAERWRGIPGHHFENGFDVQLRPERLGLPLKWRKPRRIFVNSMSDLFHEKVPDEFIARVFAVMAQASHHTFQILTKRHARMRSFLNDNCGCGKGHVPGIHLRSGMSWAGTPHSPTYVPGVDGNAVYFDRPWPLPNVMIGVSVEDQKWADIRIPALAQTPAAKRFLSCEPLLGPITLHRGHSHCPTHDFPGGFCSGACPDLIKPDWLIIGGESGPGARPMEEAWARSLVEQCRTYGISPFVKQMGSVWASDQRIGGKSVRALGDSKGGDWDHWPADLKVREFPTTATAGAR